jgi:hypothetical protein
MPLFRRPRVVRRRHDGTYELNLDAPYRDVVRDLMGQLDSLLDETPDDPSMRRLRPPAYLDQADAEAEAAYQLLAGEELRASHHAAVARVLASVDATVLSEDDLWGWLQALNAVRLVAGTRLDISEDDHAGRREPADETEASLWAVYDLTTALQHEVVMGLGR